MNVRNPFAGEISSRFRGTVLFGAAMLLVLLFAGGAFAQPWTLTINVVVDNDGFITPEAGTVTPSAEGPHEDGAEVTLTATVNPDYRFEGWTNATPDPDNELIATITMNANETVTAHYVRAEYIVFLRDPHTSRIGEPINGTVHNLSLIHI